MTQDPPNNEDHYLLGQINRAGESEEKSKPRMLNFDSFNDNYNNNNNNHDNNNGNYNDNKHGNYNDKKKNDNDNNGINYNKMNNDDDENGNNNDNTNNDNTHNSDNSNDDNIDIKINDNGDQSQYVTIHDSSPCRTPSNQLQLQLQFEDGQDILPYKFELQRQLELQLELEVKVEEESKEAETKLFRLEELEEEKRIFEEKLEEPSFWQKSEEHSPTHVPISTATSFCSLSPSRSEHSGFDFSVPKVEEDSLLLEEDLMNVLQVFDPLGKGEAGQLVS